MARNAKAGQKQKSTNGATLGFEAKLWQAEVEGDDEPFGQKRKRLTATFRELCAQVAKIDKANWSNLKELGYGE
jgi:hypothetical protein